MQICSSRFLQLSCAPRNVYLVNCIDPHRNKFVPDNGNRWGCKPLCTSNRTHTSESHVSVPCHCLRIEVCQTPVTFELLLIRGKVRQAEFAGPASSSQGHPSSTHHTMHLLTTFASKTLPQQSSLQLTLRPP